MIAVAQGYADRESTMVMRRIKNTTILTTRALRWLDPMMVASMLAQCLWLLHVRHNAHAYRLWLLNILRSGPRNRAEEREPPKPPTNSNSSHDPARTATLA